MDENVQGHTHRMAARGKATSFPLPWQDLLQQLHEGAAVEELGEKVFIDQEQVKSSRMLCFSLLKHLQATIHKLT